MARLEQEAMQASSEVTILSPSEQAQSDAGPTRGQYSPESSYQPQALGANFDWSSIGEANSGTLHPRFAYGRNRMIQCALAIDNRFPIHSRLPNPLLPLAGPSPVSRHAHPLMQGYTDTYFDTVHRCFPFLDEECVRESTRSVALENVASSPAYLRRFLLALFCPLEEDPCQAITP